MPLKIPEVITEKDFLKIINDKKVKKNNKVRMAYLLAFYQCLRISEVVKLRPEDFNPENKLIHIRQAKGHKDRKIPIAPQVVRAIKFLPYDRSIRALQYKFTGDTKRILGKPLNFHILRHSGATHYLNKKKWDIRQLQRFLGHSDIKITQIYTHVNPEDLVNKMWEDDR